MEIANQGANQRSWYVNPNNRTLTSNRKNTAIKDRENFDCMHTSAKTEDFLQASVRKAEDRAVENKVSEDKTAKDRAAEYAEKAFAYIGSRAPEEVKQAWMKAAEETGTNGLGINSNGMMSHISQMMVQRLKKSWLGGADDRDILGNSVSSALQAAKQALYDLENPLTPVNTRNMEVQRNRMKEKEFYQAFIQKLEDL